MCNTFYSMLIIISLILISCNKNSENEDSSQNLKIEKMKNENVSSQLVCNLSSKKLQDRKAALSRKLFSQVKRKKEVENGIVLFFDDENDLDVTISEFIITEKKCCPFMAFDFGIKPNNGGLKLMISGDSSVKKFLKAQFDDINTHN